MVALTLTSPPRAAADRPASRREPRAPRTLKVRLRVRVEPVDRRRRVVMVRAVEPVIGRGRGSGRSWADPGRSRQSCGHRAAVRGPRPMWAGCDRIGADVLRTRTRLLF